MLVKRQIQKEQGTDSENEDDTDIFDPGPPLLERFDKATYDCNISQPMTRINNSWNSNDPFIENGDLDLLPMDDGVYLLRLESNVEFMRITTSGEIIGTPVRIASTGDLLRNPRLLKTETGYALAWIGRDYMTNQLMFVLLDSEGNPLGTPQSLASGNIGFSKMVRFGNKSVLAFGAIQSYEIGFENSLLFLDADGSPSGDLVILEGNYNAFFSGEASIGLLAKDNELLVAWSSSKDNWEDSNAATTLRIERYNAEKNRVSPVYNLQSPVENKENIHPSWVNIGEDVGLLWS